jgi:plastocyanin domain-containing protein
MNTHTKNILLALLGVGVLIGGAVLLSGRAGTTANIPTASAGAGAALMEGSTQYIDIVAQGGFSPSVTIAKAGVPTVIRMHTENTYDCSSTVVIPDLGYEGRLKPTGVEEIPVPADKAQGTLRGVCSMGMYHFSVEFR